MLIQLLFESSFKNFSPSLNLKAERYPAGDDGVHIFGVTVAQGHEVCVERADALQTQADKSGGGELQQLGRQVISTGAPVYQRRVDLG